MSQPLTIQLLGTPQVSRGSGLLPAPRGNKAWALLAYLLATAARPGRRSLAELLFAGANDPLNVLSWNLGQLRRLLGPDTVLRGDPIELGLAPSTVVDTRMVTAGTWAQALGCAGLGRDLLERMSFASSPGFEAWLLAERRRLAVAAQRALREAARVRLAAGQADRAVDLAVRVVAVNPLDEEAQELLIRAYAATGDRASARRQRDACVAAFRRELGTDPGAWVRSAVGSVSAAWPGVGRSGRHRVAGVAEGSSPSW
jgi:DNA-binding SARP family transcriptional activator